MVAVSGVCAVRCSKEASNKTPGALRDIMLHASARGAVTTTDRSLGRWCRRQNGYHEVDAASSQNSSGWHSRRWGRSTLDSPVFRPWSRPLGHGATLRIAGGAVQVHAVELPVGKRILY